MKKLILGFTAASLCSLAPLPAFAGPYEDAVKAYNADEYTKAIALFKPLAESGNDNAQWYMGEVYNNGLGVEESSKQAFYWYSLSANNGEALAQKNLAYLYYHGEGTPQDYKSAVKWFKKAADQGNATAMYALGYCYEKGQGTKTSAKKAAKWYQLAVDDGNDSARIKLGLLYENGEGVKQNYRKAAKLYADAADNGSAMGRAYLAELYYNGKGLETDEKEGIRLYKQAAAMGSDYAIGKLEKLGIKNDLLGDAAYVAYLKKDFDEAIKLWRDRAQRADVAAMVNLGNIYKDVKEVQDYEKAMGWYKPAVTLGNSEAMIGMGDLYNYGLGVPRNYDEAYKLYGQAVYEDDPNGVYMFATMYDDGHGVEQDKGKALQMYQIAADMGNQDAKDMVKFYRDRNADKTRWDRMVANLDAIKREKAQQKRYCDEMFYKGTLEASRRSGQYYKYRYVAPSGC